MSTNFKFQDNFLLICARGRFKFSDGTLQLISQTELDSKSLTFSLPDLKYSVAQLEQFPVPSSESSLASWGWGLCPI